MSCAAPLDSSDDTALASLSLTHVSYDPSDPISLFAAYLSLIPQALMIVYVVLIYSHRELEIILALLGQLGCEVVNYVLKRVIKEARPTNMKGKGYGMPSSHAQYMFFFATYMSLWIGVRNKFIPLTHKLVLLVGLYGMAAGVATARVYLQYHTIKQVMAGVGAGVVIGTAWFVVTGLMRSFNSGMIWDLLLENEVSKTLFVKDECTMVDLQQKSWEDWWTARLQSKKHTGLKKQN